jgi:hypothetical protein
MDLPQTLKPMAFQFKQHNNILIWQTKDPMLQISHQNSGSEGPAQTSPALISNGLSATEI